MTRAVQVKVPVVNSPAPDGVTPGLVSVIAMLAGVAVGVPVTLDANSVAAFDLDDGAYTFVAQCADSNGAPLGTSVSTDFTVSDPVVALQFSQPVGPLVISMV